MNKPSTSLFTHDGKIYVCGKENAGEKKWDKVQIVWERTRETFKIKSFSGMWTMFLEE